MARGRGQGHGEILTPAETESLLGERRELEDSLKETQSYGLGTRAEQLDKARLQSQIKRIDEAIAARQAPKVSGVEKDKLVKEAEELGNKLKEGLPTRDEMDNPAKNPGAVRKHLRWIDNNKRNVERWRYLQRVLNPDDPRSIENMRREK